MNFNIIEKDEDFTLVEFKKIEETCFTKDPYGFKQFSDIYNHYFLVARLSNGNAVGYCYTKNHGDALYIHRLAVLEKYRRLGIGKSLVNHVLDYAKKAKYPSCMLTVDACNEGAYKLYVKMGFSELNTKYRYTLDVKDFKRRGNVYCVTNGESDEFIVSFYIEDRKIGSCKFNSTINDCKDFILEDPGGNLYYSLSSLINVIESDREKIHVMTEDLGVFVVLDKFKYEHKKILNEMVVNF